MGFEFDFPQGADPREFTAADWSRASRKVAIRPSAQSVTPNELATSTTALIDSTSQTAAASAANAAQAAAVAAATALATNAQSGAETTAAGLATAAQNSAVSTASNALSSHATDSGDPHSAAGYLKQADTDALYLTQTQADARYLRQVLTLTNAVDDVAAAAASVAIGHLYRNGSVVMIRVT